MRLDRDSIAEEQQAVKQSFFGSLRRDTHWKCLILTMLICGCLTAILWCRFTVASPSVVPTIYDMHFYNEPSSAASPCEDGYIYIPVAFVVMLYLVYLVECWHCHTRIELHYKVDVNTVYEKIHTMKESLPIVWWKAICYHYVRRTRQVTRYRNGDAFTTTQVYYERINSHTSSSAFNFSICGMKDMSKHLVNLEQYPATKIKFSKGFSFATIEAEHEFEDQRAQFFQDHERRDDYMEIREGLDLMNVNFKEYMIAFADPDNLPWYVSHIVFWIMSVLLLSWPLRVLIEYKTAYVHYHVHKVFGCNYLDPAFCPPQGMTRVSTMESSELEMNIRNNFSMVPSYSEALLMDGTVSQDANANSITPSVSFHNGYVHIPGNVVPRTYPNGRVPSGYVPGGGIVITNGVAHAVSGPIPMSLSNGNVSNGGLANGNSLSGGVPAWVVRRYESEVPDSSIHGRRRKRKKKRRRYSIADPEALDCDHIGASISRVNANRPQTSSSAISTTPESLTSDDAMTIANPGALARTPSLPPSESCPNVSSQQLQDLQASSTIAQQENDVHLRPVISPPHLEESELGTPNVSVLSEAPPSYELAITMRHPLPPVLSTQNVENENSNRPIRLMETSL